MGEAFYNVERREADRKGLRATAKMRVMAGFRCRHAFEAASVHANGDVVCSIIDGRGDFVIGNIHEQSLPSILNGDRAHELRKLVLSTEDAYCRAIGKSCALKTIPVQPGETVPVVLRFLAIEATSACDLRCLTCPIRDFSRDVGWRDAWRDGGAAFAMWDGSRRLKQHLADALKRLIPPLGRLAPSDLPRALAFLLRGRVSRAARNGTLSLETIERLIGEAGPSLERIDFFQYGEPFLYRHVIDALRIIRRERPSVTIAISTDGMQVKDKHFAIVDEHLVDWLIFSVDGVDDATYGRYRIRGRFDTAFGNMRRFHARAAGTGVRVIWQYVVFRWNDTDAHFARARELADAIGIPVWFDFAHTWGRSTRDPNDVRYLAPHLRPYTALPGESRQEGW